MTLVLRGERVVLRPVRAADADRLAEILAEPSVARWWGVWDRARVQQEFVDETEGHVPCAVEVEGEVVGLIQYAEEEDPDYRHAGIDLFLASRRDAGVRALAGRDLARRAPAGAARPRLASVS